MRPLALLALLALACANPVSKATPAPATSTPTAPTPAAVSTSPTPPAPTSAIPADFCADSAKASPEERAARDAAWALFSASPGSELCDAGAWVTDPDPAGLNVRDAPSTEGKILQALKDGPTVHVAARNGNWVLLCGQAASGDPDQPSWVAYGWVYATKLGTGTRGYDKGYSPLYAEASATAAEVGRVPTEGEVAVLTCSGRWLKVRHDGKEGWLDPHERCANQITTCP
jgi:SH3-like domain-containing protein